ncbi:MAG: type II toxin-antitoxin system MqsR family toxin [Lentisphaerae bacterium]|jgi:hypothetical protein|nr:type II toxin-antitoxin system MqsR family toxin [Lentisphaerota bacterium]
MDRKRHKKTPPFRKAKAVYELKTVREILRHPDPNPNVKWVFRKDERNKYEKLGYTLSQALNIVRMLRPKDFDISSPASSDRHAQTVDVYKIQDPYAPREKPRKLYMKFFVRFAETPDQADQLVMISFHD